MDVYDWVCLEEVLANAHYQFKAIMNATGIILFPMTRQHREAKAEGLSYEDGATGNALAAVISPRQIGIRHHPHFAAETVKQILKSILQDERLQALRDFTVTYQGKVIKQGGAETKRDRTKNP